MASHSSGNKRGYSCYDYGSEFEPDSDVERKKASRLDLSQKPAPISAAKPSKTVFVEERSKDEARYMRHHYVSTNAYARHKELVNNYLMYYGGKMSDFNDTSAHRTDKDIIRENHKFVWEEGDEADSWDKRLAKKYYDKLYKEYCLADLSRYKENKVGMRWRTEKEVIRGKGQFVCGNKVCSSEDDLRSWEVNFSYVEQEVKKNTLVKLRLCSSCSEKLNYKNKRKEITSRIAEEKEEITSDKKKKKKRRTDGDIDDAVNRLLL